MQRETISFADFKTNFIDHAEGGYYPVYSFLAEDKHGNHIKIIKMDMICEWRLADGEIKFIQVPFETDEEYNDIAAYLRIAARYLHEYIMCRIDKLNKEATNLF